MPLPSNILAKRGIDPSLKLDRVKDYLVTHCDTDSFRGSWDILHVCQFMLSHDFQQFIHSWPVNKAIRHNLETHYMKARLRALD